jgi:molybdenum cofactor guanylyltransferase
MTSPGSPDLQPIGVVLAGGAGRRLGGAKATVAVGGAPLVGYPVAALRAVVGEVAIQAKPDTALPALAGVAIWTEPAQPRHPLVGLVHALERAAPRGVLVCAGDMPFVSAALLSRIAGTPGGAAVVAAAGGRIHPLLAYYRPVALGALRDALERHPDDSLTAAVQTLGPVVLEVPEIELTNVNTPEDLRRVEALLASRR